MSRKHILLALALTTPVFAQTSAPPATYPGPRPVLQFSDPRGNEVITIDNDGTLNFDFGGTVAWSRYFVGEWSPPACKHVWVLTWVNAPEGRRALFLRGCEAIQATDRP